MEHFLVDTNIIVDILRGYKPSAELVEALGEVNLSVVSYYELLQGVENIKEQKELILFLDNYPIIYLSEVISRNALSLVTKYNLSHNVQYADALVASMCLEHGLTLCTRNIKHFKGINGLKLYDL